MAEPSVEAVLCMDERERAEWAMWNRRSAYLSADSPCEDCTLAFAAEMRAAGTCNGDPVVRYCRRCKAWWPLEPDYWDIQERAAGQTAGRSANGHVIRRTASSTAYKCVACRVRWQNLHYARIVPTPEAKHERRLAQWRAYQKRRKARMKTCLTT